MVNEALYEDEIEEFADDESNEPPLHVSEAGFSQEVLANAEHHTADGYQDSGRDGQEQANGYANGHFGPQPAETHASLDPLDQLPLALTLRCGSLDLTLGELRSIAAGTVLSVSGVAPGFATLCHGERIVAEGELVEVDGRLGLQITRMASFA